MSSSNDEFWQDAIAALHKWANRQSRLGIDAQDLLQEAARQLLVSLARQPGLRKRFEADATFLSRYTHGIVRHVAARLRRQRGYVFSLDDTDPISEVPSYEGISLDKLVALRSKVQKKSNAAFAIDVLEHWFADPSQKLSHAAADVGRRKGITAQTAKNRLARGLPFLRRLLEG